jgi:hypothetical protein
MATGLVGSTNGVFTWRILDARTSTNSAPSGSSAGLANPKDNIWPLPQKAVVAVYSTAGSATMTATIKLWGYLTDAAQWFPLGIGADALKGVMNGGAAIGETGTNVLQHAEIVEGLFSFDRIYAEVVAIGGTSTAVTVDVRIGPA